MRALLLLVVAGCITGSPSTIEPTPTYHCSPRDPAIDGPIFTQLTANRWGCNGPGLCLAFEADGDLIMTENGGDYEISFEHRWNFVARDASSGQVCLDDGSVIDFALVPGGLRWDTAGIMAGVDPLTVAGSRDALDQMLTSQLFAALTAHAWTKTNELDLFSEPTYFSLQPNGTYTAEYRYGECLGAGTFSVHIGGGGLVSQDELHPIPLPNSCDTRRGTTASVGASNEAPHLDAGDTLRFYRSTFRPAAVVTEERVLSYSSYGGGDAGLVTSARWQGELRADAALDWAMTFTNDTDRAQTITSTKISMTPVDPTSDGYTTIGPAIALVDRVDSIALDPDATHAGTESLALPPAGTYSLQIDIGSFDVRQTYRNLTHHIVDLR